MEEASALRERFREAEARFNDASKDAAGVVETTREELTLASEQRSELEKREGELKRRVEGLEEVVVHLLRCATKKNGLGRRACYHVSREDQAWSFSCEQIINSTHANTALGVPAGSCCRGDQAQGGSGGG